MPQDYFQYDRRFGDQRFQNQRRPDGRPNTYNRFESFRPFCPPQNGCFPPQFGPQWGNQCSPCDLEEIKNRNAADIRATELQKKVERNKLITNLALGGLGLIALFPLLGFLKKTVGTPAISDNNNTTVTTTNRGTTTTTTKDAAYFKAEKARISGEMKEAIELRKKDAEAAKKQEEALKKEQEALETEQKNLGL